MSFHARELEGIVGAFGAAAAAGAERSRMVRAHAANAAQQGAWAQHYADRAVIAEADAEAAKSRAARLDDENAVLLVEVDKLSEECLALSELVAALRAGTAH